MNGTIPSRLPWDILPYSLPWYERHEVNGRKEIFQWSKDCYGNDPWTGDAPHIDGAIYAQDVSIAEMYQKYKDDIIAEEEGFLGFYADLHDCVGFKSWEDARTWLNSDEDL